MAEWQPIDSAPRDARWLCVKMADGSELVAHYAEGDGENTPPFKGWFVEPTVLGKKSGYFAEIDTPTHWRPVERCSSCGEVANPGGVLGVADDGGISPTCFACVFVACLGDAACSQCNKTPCAGYVVAEDRGRFLPLAVCYGCITNIEMGEPALKEKGRRIIPDAGTVG